MAKAKPLFYVKCLLDSTVIGPVQPSKFFNRSASLDTRLKRNFPYATCINDVPFIGHTDKEMLFRAVPTFRPKQLSVKITVFPNNSPVTLYVGNISKGRMRDLLKQVYTADAWKEIEEADNELDLDEYYSFVEERMIELLEEYKITIDKDIKPIYGKVVLKVFPTNARVKTFNIDTGE